MSEPHDKLIHHAEGFRWADQRTAAIPVILLSAVVEPGQATACADVFLTKPFDIDQLGAIVARFLAPG